MLRFYLFAISSRACIIIVEFGFKFLAFAIAIDHQACEDHRYPQKQKLIPSDCTRMR